VGEMISGLAHIPIHFKRLWAWVSAAPESVERLFCF
jgi:hypothetical protein